MNVYIVTLIILLFYLALAWIAGALLRLHGASLWILRGSLTFIGLLAAGLFLWFHHRLKRRGSSLAPSQFAGIADQVKILLRQAEQSLARGRQGSLGSLPIVFVLGDLNSAKTSTMVHSGLEPELVAGQVFQDNDIVPTATINVWFARKTVFIECGGKLAANPQLWGQVLRHTRPKRMSAAVGRGQQAPRAALVCLDCERLASPKSVQSLASRIKEMARSLGAPFPVYVLFTKLDRIPHFADFVGNLTSEESTQILGATLPRVSAHGVFAEEESKRLAKAFDQILYALAEKRLDYLGRETVAQKMPGIYEFPRELRKSRNQVVQLLVELSRPTQLNANPFLRGFYFSGVRAVVINEAVSVPAMARAASALGSGATRMFNVAEVAPATAQSVPKRAVQSRKVPEWAFLPHLFTEVVLADPVASSASHHSRRVERLRWGLLGSLALILLFLGLALVVSFFNNRSLENEITSAAERQSAIPGGAAVEAPGIEQLRQLDQLRGSVATLSKYQSEGPPWSYRFGLYVGDRLYPEARRLYFQSFRRLLLASTQARIAAILSQPPGTRGSDDFQQMYSTLKAYLITTSNHEHADWNSLVPVLLGRSPAFESADAEAKELIRRQFSFYAENLILASPFGPENDTLAVAKARAYLKQFDAFQAIYQAMLDDAGKGKKPVNFNRQFPQAAPFVVDNYEVPAAFSKDGFAVMQKLLQNPEKFRGEEWVLGAPATLSGSVDSLRDTLTRQYAADYMNHWRAYLKNAHVVGFAGLRDAAPKLSRLIANDSPLLQLLWLAKENTAVDIPDIKNPFDAVQTIARDSTLEKLVGSGSQEYMGALSGLQNTVQNVVNTANGLTDPGMLSQVQQAASSASGTVKRIEQRFTIDAQGGVDKNVSRLLEEPIESANRAAASGAAAPAEAVCALVNGVTSRRPFNQRSSQQATLQEVQDLFRPQGTLWSTVQSKLGTAIQHQGSNWINTGSAPQSQNFLAFLNRAQQFSDTLFPNNSTNVHLAYTLRRLPTSGIDQATLVIDGQSLTEIGPAQQFVWQGRDSLVSLSVTAAGQRMPTLGGQGPWALFEFLGSADKWIGGSPATLDWQLQVQAKFGGRQVSESAVRDVQYELTTQGAPVFKKEFLASLHCSAH